MRKLTTNQLTRKQKLRALATSRGDYHQSPDLDKMNDSIELLRSVIHELVLAVKEGQSINPEHANTIYKLSNSLSGLSRARNEAEKTRLETHQLYALAGSEILNNMRNWLCEFPQLDEAIQELIEKSTNEASINRDTSP